MRSADSVSTAAGSPPQHQDNYRMKKSEFQLRQQFCGQNAAGRAEKLNASHHYRPAQI